MFIAKKHSRVYHKEAQTSQTKETRQNANLR